MSRLFISTVILLALLNASSASADEVTIATGHTIIKRILDPIRCAFKDKTGLDLKIIYSDPTHSFAELEKGTVDIAGMSLPLEDWIELAKKGGVAIKDTGAYTSYIPVTEKLMIVVNEGNRVKTLSKTQLKEVFTGKIHNWKDVGGDDAPILVVWPSVSSGAMIVFMNKILDNEPLTKAVYDVGTIAETADAVASTLEAIGIITGSKSETGTETKEIAPAIERPLTLVYKKKPSPNLQKLLDFLHSEGKLYIK